MSNSILGVLLSRTNNSEYCQIAIQYQHNFCFKINVEFFMSLCVELVLCVKLNQPNTGYFIIKENSKGKKIVI